MNCAFSYMIELEVLALHKIRFGKFLLERLAQPRITNAVPRPPSIHNQAILEPAKRSNTPHGIYTLKRLRLLCFIVHSQYFHPLAVIEAAMSICERAFQQLVNLQDISKSALQMNKIQYYILPAGPFFLQPRLTTSSYHQS
jgi:hypothetical protein